MYIHQESRCVYVNILYYGASASGKTENVFHMYSLMNPSLKDVRKTVEDRRVPVVIYDSLYLQDERFQGFQVRWALHTVPGMIWYAYQQKFLCANIDGAVFVVDSQFSRLETNVACLHELLFSLRENGWNITEFPWLIQYNKRDLPSAAPIPYIQSKLHAAHIPYTEASAHVGEGVMETLRLIARLVANTYRFTNTHSIQFSHAILPKRWPEKDSETLLLKP